MRAAARDSLARAALDPAELFDVDVDELAGPSPLIALRGLLAEPAQLAHRDPGEDSRHRRQRHLEHPAISGPVIRNLRSSAITAIRRSSVRFANPSTRRAAIKQPDSEASRNLDTHLEHVFGVVLNTAAAALMGRALLDH